MYSIFNYKEFKHFMDLCIKSYQEIIELRVRQRYGVKAVENILKGGPNACFLNFALKSKRYIF